MTPDHQQLAERLALIVRVALDRIDGDSPQDTAWSEIIGIAQGDPHWLQHARTNHAHAATSEGAI